jgi:Uncharacterised nucleotidyltransferase
VGWSASCPWRRLAEPIPEALGQLGAAVGRFCGTEAGRPPRDVDWGALAGLAVRHHVAPILQRSGWLERYEAPPDARALLSHLAHRGARQSLRALAVQDEALEVLEHAGVDAIVLKGAAVGLGAYGDPSARPAGDVDLLVDPDVVPRAVGALRDAGFDWVGWRVPGNLDWAPIDVSEVLRLPLPATLYHVTLSRNGVDVEVHWRLFMNRRLLPVRPGWLTNPRPVTNGEVTVPTLPLGSEWLYANLHGLAHRWSRMKWLADIPRLAIQTPALTDPAALRRAEAAGYGRPLAAALIVAEAVLGEFLRPESRAWARGVRGTRVLVRGCSEALAAPAGRKQAPMRPARLAREVRWRLELRRDPRYRLAELRRLSRRAASARAIDNPALREVAIGPLRLPRKSARRESIPASAVRSGLDREH